MGTAAGIIRALNSGARHLAVKRFTLRYPEEKLKFVGDGYQFDPVSGSGIAGYKGPPHALSRQVHGVPALLDRLRGYRRGHIDGQGGRGVEAQQKSR